MDWNDGKAKQSRVNEKQAMNCGMCATIIAYRKYNDIDIRFNDGTIVVGCSYYNFLRGGISNPSLGRNYTQRKNKRIGTRQRMRNGLFAEIIEYRKASDIDVRFEDGTTVYHKSYSRFIEGRISKPSVNHIGEKAKMKNGMFAEIVAYRKSSDIDVCFEDNTIVLNKAYGEFKNGEIANPSIGKFASVRSKFQYRVGEQHIMNNGMLATIKKYNSSSDIFVEFEDGTEVRTKYAQFKKGAVRNPNFVVSGESLYEGVLLYYLTPLGYQHFTATMMSEAGLGRYEIDAFNLESHSGIEIDGFFHQKKQNADEKKNARFFKDNNKKLIRIRDKSLPKLKDNNSIDFYIDMNERAFSKGFETVLKSMFTIIDMVIDVNLDRDREAIVKEYYKNHSNKRIKETKMMNCGMNATIIEYRRSDDIDVIFEDNTVVTGKSYKSFSKGEILNPNYNVGNKRIGEKKRMNCGMEARIIEYRGPHDIDVQFEDNTVVQHKEYFRFLRGGIKNPELIKNRHLGEEKQMNCGMKATIIEYRRSDDLDVVFEDGTKVEKKTYKSFKNGRIANPRYGLSQKRIGEKAKMKCGLEAKIIAYRNNEDMDIQFEDGVIAFGKAYGNFKAGEIAHPTLTQKTLILRDLREKRLGESQMMNCGMKATIIEYRRYNDIDVEFENGSIAKHQNYNRFCKGSINCK